MTPKKLIWGYEKYNNGYTSEDELSKSGGNFDFLDNQDLAQTLGNGDAVSMSMNLGYLIAR